jgi:polysaccharide biosynthesis transport protein
MADEDAAAPRNRIVDGPTIASHAAWPDQFPRPVRPGDFNPGRSKEPLLRLWRRMLGRYWLRAIVLWLAISGIVWTLTYYPLNLSFINFRLVFAMAMITGAAAAIWGVFQLIEIRSGRVSDPDVLADRMQSPVYTLPPMPRVDAIRKSDPVAAGVIYDNLFHGIDHIWFAICGNREEPWKGQCVLVTSAIHGEGKSTLAAQLALRCGNFGTSTLLIDADLRWSGLSQLLDFPAGPGLTEMLICDADLDDTLIPANEGTFHFLPAGTPVQDTVPYLRDPKFGMVIARCRERFVLTIIDCGPVVPSPDPLALCKWVDGVLFAARYDFSRYPNMEWAERKLAATGVPVIAVVLNCYPIDDPPV